MALRRLRDLALGEAQASSGGTIGLREDEGDAVPGGDDRLERARG
jgi:hypothetical protein